MPPNERLAARPFPMRAFSYETGASGGLEERAVAEETPVEIVFGGVPFAVMMATPTDLEDYVHGFAFTEGAVERADDIADVTIEPCGDALRANVTLRGAAMSAHLSRKRAMAGRTGCGVCGLEDLEQLRTPVERAHAPRGVAPRAVGAAIRALDAAQPLNALTHAAHAALWCSKEGEVLLTREDVGRHNALDKLIGAMLRARVAADDGFIVITSRCSYEMVVKSARIGARTLVAVSAPTTLALQTARRAGVELIAIARRDRASAFTFADADRGEAA